MEQVGRNQTHCDYVTGRYNGRLKAIEQVLKWLARLVVRMDCSSGEVQQMNNQEDENPEPADQHGSRRQTGPLVAPRHV